MAFIEYKHDILKKINSSKLWIAKKKMEFESGYIEKGTFVTLEFNQYHHNDNTCELSVECALGKINNFNIKIVCDEFDDFFYYEKDLSYIYAKILTLKEFDNLDGFILIISAAISVSVIFAGTSIVGKISIVSFSPKIRIILALSALIIDIPQIICIIDRIKLKKLMGYLYEREKEFVTNG